MDFLSGFGRATVSVHIHRYVEQTMTLHSTVNDKYRTVQMNSTKKTVDCDPVQKCILGSRAWSDSNASLTTGACNRITGQTQYEERECGCIWVTKKNHESRILYAHLGDATYILLLKGFKNSSQSGLLPNLDWCMNAVE